MKILKYSCWSSEDTEVQQDYVNQVLIEETELVADIHHSLDKHYLNKKSH